MNASEMTFGIEIETTITRGSLVVGGYTRGQQVPGLPEGWTAKYDASIRVGRRDRVGCEIVSPVLRGADGLHQIIEVCRVMRSRYGAQVNSSTGLHVHVGFDRNNRAVLRRLTALVANFEKAIYASTGTKSREMGRWCGSVQRHGDVDRAIEHAGMQRYHVLNLTNLMGRGHGHATVEFRAFAGTLNPDKIIAHVRQCLAIVERAYTAKRITNWAAKQVAESSPIHRRGEGQTALTRFFYQVGWIKGRTSHTHGAIEAEGLPTIQQSKRTLMRLARKYDSR